MDHSKTILYNIASSLPYKIHPNLHFFVYKCLIGLGLKNIVQDHVVKFMAKHIKLGDCVIDIGANQGTYTYSLLKAVGNEGVVYSFEPNPITVRQLRKNIRCPNVIIENKAVSDINENKVFYIHTKGCGPTSSLEFYKVLKENGELKDTTVETVTFDSFCDTHKLTPKLIKIDVEGHEFNVIKGAEQTIKNYHPYIVFEFIEQFWESKSIKEIFEILNPTYHLIRLEDNRDAMTEYANYSPPCHADFRKSRVVNIGCIPRNISKPL